jgi:class 3 adenylate cyclase
MPLYVDIHRLDGLTLHDVATSHSADVAIQAKYGVEYMKYWVNEKAGKVFCMCSAPDAEAAERVHLESHGMKAERIIEVDEDLAESMMGGGFVESSGCVMHENRPDPGARTIMFTDIVGSTALTQELGDQAGMALVEAHDRVVRKALRMNGGHEVKHLGDGIMAAFISADDACACASQIQRELREQKEAAPAPIRLKIGAASGDPVERQGDFFGSTVQLASRLCAAAEPGQTLVSSTTIALTPSNKFDDLGEVHLKGFTAPVRAHRLIAR